MSAREPDSRDVVTPSSERPRTPVGRLDAATTVQERLARWLIPPGPFRVGPFLVHLDPRDHLMRTELALYGAYEPYQVDVLRSVVAPGDVVVDAGAHVGLYTLWASRAVGRSGRIVAFEPDPDNRRLLERTLAVNRVENVDVEGAGPMFQRDPPRAVFTEVTTELLDAFGSEPDDLVRELAALGLRPFVIDERSRTLVPRRPADLLADIHRRGVRTLLWRREEP